MTKIMSFDEFKKDVKLGIGIIQFKEMIKIAKWLCYDLDDKNTVLENIFIKELFKRYISIYKKVEKNEHRIGRSSSSRF